MEKIIFNKNTIIFKIDNEKGLFTRRIKTFYNGELIEKDYATIYYQDKVKYIFYEAITEEYSFNIAGRFYNYKTITSAEKLKNDDPVTELTKVKNFKLLEVDDNIFLTSEKGKEYKVLIEFYTNETYPDFSFEEKKIEILSTGKDLLIKKSKGEILKIFIQDNEGELTSEIFEGKPICYFSSTRLLKEDIEELGLKLNEKTEEKYKKLIIEKSIYVKEKHGLLLHQTKRVELMPLLKSLVNLLVIKEILSVYFIKGDDPINFDSNVQKGLGNLKLGEFNAQSNETRYNATSICSLDIINSMIANAEKDLQKALFKPSSHIENNKIEVTKFEYFRKI